MKIILLKDVAKLGRKHDVKNVSDGHALNLLIPQGLVIPATPEALKQLEIQKAKTEGQKKVHEGLLAQNMKNLGSTTITIAGKANEKGHLFAGLHREVIAQELSKQSGLQIDPSFIQVEHPIKEIGEHQVEVKGGGKSAKFTLVVKAV